MTFQQESNASFMLPPCKDIIREAAAGSLCDIFNGQEQKDSISPSVESSPDQAYRAMANQEQARGEYSRPQSSYAHSISNSSSSPVSMVSPKMSSFSRFVAKRRDCSAAQYHPYKKDNCAYSINHNGLPLPALKTSFDQRAVVGAPRSPPNTRKSSFAASDSSSSFGRAGFVFGEEDIVTTPLTPLTQHSDETHTIKEETMMFDSSLVQRYQQTQENMKGSRQSAELAKAARRRKAHLQSEQRRREHIKDGMDRLVQIVPACQESRDTKGISKAAILKHAYEYIYHLRAELQGYKQMNQNKDREIAELRRRLGHPHTVPPAHWR
ncbi:hypothetical protein TWF173_000713 [Orbilia oligospora]|uniref:BHLH domain-containing protein n=2 Tax=Orbilia oligospora TaxID=2813651 RepID=G1XKJ9_ARTOA|nr:hypothetical protein AOL_s00110g19 [Orbilia oligospora ATCC 24927]EGX46195.1 hypothetical protein AOL_s00110g19 [Orbilia oligospora ATCC 24927]KAF3281263.1 hypothetical protein TWF970_002421 [Orbilia oligospora]KAF3308837.1 hypothetical protein TWF173_000713 [Orbilia oligospora]